MKIASPVLCLNNLSLSLPLSQAVRLSSPHKLEMWILSLIYYTQMGCVSHPSLSLTFIKRPASLSVEFTILLISMNDGSLPLIKGGQKGESCDAGSPFDIFNGLTLRNLIYICNELCINSLYTSST